MNGVLLDIAAVNRRNLSGSLVDFSSAARSNLSGSLLSVGADNRHIVDVSLAEFGFVQLPPTSLPPFKGRHAVGIGDYQIRASIGGESVNVCELTDTLRIAHGENENYTCEFVLRKGSLRRAPRPIDPYRWYARPISVWLSHSGGSLLIYRGFVDGVKLEPLKGTLTVKASDRRERMINALPKSTVKSIGYTSKAVHGEFADQLDELNKRLSTVPASFEFDLRGNGYLNPWQPQNPTMTLTPCMIYQQDPVVDLAEARSVINETEVRLTFNYSRLLHRVLIYQMNVGINVCQYYAYGHLPTLPALHDAAGQTGWQLGGFDLEREAATGWYSCGGAGGRLGWKRRPDSTEFVGGTFEMLKRWTQPVSETYVLTLRNRASIARYELGREEISYTAAAEPTVKDWGGGRYGPHADGLKYRVVTGDRFFADAAGMPRIGGAEMAVAANGDRYFNDDGNGRVLPDALQTAYWTAYVKMLSSHRQNTVQVQAKLLPHISIRHSHRIQHSHFNGVAKVARFEHTFDFKTKRGSTAVQYRFFQNGVNGSLTQLSEPPRPQPSFPQRDKYLWLGKAEIDEKADVNKYWGMIYRRFPPKHGSRLFKPLVLRIRTPEIERQSTDTAQLEQAQVQEVGIPNNRIEMRL